MAPVELTESFYSNLNKSSNLIPLKDINFSNFVETETKSAALPSTREVITTQYLQDLKTLIKIQKKDPKDDFEFVEKIGKGGYSKVYKVINKQTGKISALKQIKLVKSEDREQVINEIGIMQFSKHSNIVQCFTCYEFLKYFIFSEFYIEMEYMDFSLSKLVKQLSGKMTEKMIAYIIREILQGLSWLHRNNRVHLDIKSSNILISKTGEVKLTDFGISKQLTRDNNEGINIVGTPCWMAPELITSRYHDSKADIWSLGIVLMELCEVDPPHIGKDKLLVMEIIANGPSPTLKTQNKWSKHLLAFFKSCVKKIPEQRPTADELLRHIFIHRVGSEGKENFVAFMNQEIVN